MIASGILLLFSRQSARAFKLNTPSHRIRYHLRSRSWERTLWNLLTQTPNSDSTVSQAPGLSPHS